MKYIIKRQDQDDLTRFKFEMRDDPNLGYSHQEFPRGAVINSLLEDQGNFCAYTMQRINNTSCHIEHFKPQSICRKEDNERSDNGIPVLNEDIDWRNLFACYPAPLRKTRENPHPKEPGYGAIQRKNLPIGVSPLNPDCENLFTFMSDGSISATEENAKNAIKMLNLCHKSLCEQREAKIKEIGLHPASEDPLSPEEAKALLTEKWKDRSEVGFMEFCVAIRGAAKEYLQSLEKQFELLGS